MQGFGREGIWEKVTNKFGREECRNHSSREMAVLLLSLSLSFVLSFFDSPRHKTVELDPGYKNFKIRDIK